MEGYFGGSTKDALLRLLEERRGQSLSGEEAAKTLGITRSAVWKAVKALEQDGYIIDAATKRGYSMSPNSNVISVQGLLPYLRKGVDPEKIAVYKILESTNKTAKEMAVKGAGHGFVIIADAQTAGKGRNGKSFYSPEENGLYISLILSPEAYFLPNAAAMTIAAAGVVCLSVSRICKAETAIKPINDILFKGKKVCGILTEAVLDLESGHAEWFVVGIGINIGSNGFPDELKNIATSLYSKRPEANVRNLLAAEIINLFLSNDLKDEFFDVMLQEYEQRVIG